MDQDRQGFVEFVEHVHPMRSVYTQIAKTGRGLYTKLNMERCKHFNDLCKNMQAVLNMIAQGKIKVNKDVSELSGLRRYNRDLCRALKNRRKFRERVKSMKTGPQMSRSIAKLANKALAHREELKEQGRWKPSRGCTGDRVQPLGVIRLNYSEALRQQRRDRLLNVGFTHRKLMCWADRPPMARGNSPGEKLYPVA